MHEDFKRTSLGLPFCFMQIFWAGLLDIFAGMVPAAGHFHLGILES